MTYPGRTPVPGPLSPPASGRHAACSPTSPSKNSSSPGGAAFGARWWRGPVRGCGAKPACSCKPCASCSTRSLIDHPGSCCGTPGAVPPEGTPCGAGGWRVGPSRCLPFRRGLATGSRGAPPTPLAPAPPISLGGWRCHADAWGCGPRSPAGLAGPPAQATVVSGRGRGRRSGLAALAHPAHAARGRRRPGCSAAGRGVRRSRGRVVARPGLGQGTGACEFVGLAPGGSRPGDPIGAGLHIHTHQAILTPGLLPLPVAALAYQRAPHYTR